MPTRRAPRIIATVVGVVVVLIGLPLALVAVSRARFGQASPLHGMDAPWHWTLDSASSWWHHLTDQLDTSAELIDLFLRIALVVGWLCLAVIVVTLVGEVIFQLRHGMPSSGHRNVLGLGWIGRALAGGLVALLPMASTTPALAGGPAARPAVAGVSARQASTGPVVQQTPAARPGPSVAADPVWTTYTVQRGDSVWSIASRMAGPADDAGTLAGQIVEANRGATMPDGQRFTTPALIEPGWVLNVPGGSPETPPVPPSEHAVEAGDSYWRIATDHLAEVQDSEPRPAEVLAYTEALIEANAPRLGHTDPALIIPGETVVLPDLAVSPAPEASPPAPEPTAAAGGDSAAPTEVDPAPPAFVPVATTPPAPVPAPVPSPSVARAVAAPSSVVASATTEESDSSPVGIVLGGSVLAAAGVVGLIEARRRQRLRAAAVGQRLVAPSASTAATERSMRALAQPELIARLDVALRAAAPDLAGQGRRPVAVEATPSGELRMTTDGPALPGNGPWRLDSDGVTWVLAARLDLEDLAVDARGSMTPCPALAHVGATPTGQLFVDLEAIGLLLVDLPEPLATDVVRCLAASVALSPLAGSSQVVLVGMPADRFVAAATILDEAASLDAALELAAAALGTMPTAARTTSTFDLRARGIGGEAWEPAVVFVAGDTGAEALDAARRAAGDGLAVVTVARGCDAEWRIEARDDCVVIEPLGLTLTPCGLGVGELADIRALVADVETPLELRARVVPLPSAVALEARLDEEPAPAGASWSLMVRLYGQVEVVTAAGVAASFDKSKSLELVAWLSQHRRHPTRGAARAALWDVDVRDATFANVVSDARRAMARAVAPPEGSEWLARTLSDELPLHCAVVSDADVLAAAQDEARRCSPQRAIEVLRCAVEHVTGMPFAGTSYLWPDAEGISSALTLLAVGAATHLAELCLARGDTEGVFWATGRGLAVLAGHEELIALRMRAHAAHGDLAGVRHEWAAYERALDADPWSAAQPSPKLVAVRHELLSAPGVAAGG